MKNKKLEPFLIVAALGVWGVITYRIVAGFTGNEDPADLPQRAPLAPKIYNDFALHRDTVQLALNYPDPFGLQKKVDTPVVHQLSLHNRNTVMPAAVTFNWSFVSYDGYLRNPQSKKLLAMLTINGKTISLGEGESAEKLRLLKNLQDSVKVSFEGKTTYLILKTGTL